MGKVAIIGGSGIKDSPLVEGLKWEGIETKVSNGFGSNGFVRYQESQEGFIFIPRHGQSPHSYGPSRTQYGANVVAAKLLGAQAIIATSAV